MGENAGLSGINIAAGVHFEICGWKGELRGLSGLRLFSACISISRTTLINVCIC